MESGIVHFKVHGDERGQLVALEEGKEIPFLIRRVYYMYGVGPGIRRGYHAHRTLKQMHICLHGSCKILLDDGRERSVIRLDNPDEGLYIDRPVWRELFDFSPDAVLAVLASELYNESDYIRDYNQFLAYQAQSSGLGREARL